MPELLIQLTKRTDGGALLRCVRTDGSVTWQRQRERHAAFFPLHDITHYAVESELGFRAGFYGLIANGWDIDDTQGTGPRGALPAETLAVEHIVGLMDAQRASNAAWTAAELNEQTVLFASGRGLPAPRALDDAELARVRARMDDLFERWAALAAGATLELPFERAAPVVS